MKTEKKKFTIMTHFFGTTNIFKGEDERERRLECERNNCNENGELTHTMSYVRGDLKKIERYLA